MLASICPVFYLMLNAVSIQWLKLKRKKTYSISIQPCGHKTQYYQTNYVNYHHYSVLIYFCGFKSAS